MRVAGVLLLIAWASCTYDSQKLTCPMQAPVSGAITEGRLVQPGTELVLPLKVVVLIESSILIEKVTVGRAPARLTDATMQRWEALLSDADLEENRTAGTDAAKLDVVATDVCKTNHAIDSASVALPPSSSVAAADLAISEEHVPADDCSIPTGGSVTPLIRVTASSGSVGAKVTVRVSQGKLAEGGTSADLRLVNAGDHTEATTFFVPGDAAGIAVVTASAKGSMAKPLSFRVVERPRIEAPVAVLARGTTYNATVLTDGNLASCAVEEAVAGASTVSVVEPNLGEIKGVVSLREDPLSCDMVERARIAIKFLTTAPDDAAVTLRCFDTYGRDQSKTFTIVKPPEPAE